MDVLLLTRLLKELIIDNDRIPLPGMGYFLTEPMPAYFSEDRKTIYPPSRRISFKADERASGELVPKHYASSSGIDEETASSELHAFLKQLRITLFDKKSIDFPGIGRLRCTLEGNIYFVMDNTGSGIFAQAFGFEPVTLKPVSRDSRPAVPLPEPIPMSQVPETEQPVRAGVGNSRRRIWIIVLSVLAAIIIAAVILILLGRSGHLDSLFYSDEELELIQQQGA